MIKNKLALVLAVFFFCNILGGMDTPAVIAANKAPVINSFFANPSSINTGQTTTLSWSVNGATAITINQGVGDVTHLSSIIVAPPNSLTYTLTASNRYGIRNASISVSVNSTPVPTPSPTPVPTPVPGGTGRVQGYKVDSNNQQFGSPGATITVAGQTFGPSTNPYISTVPAGSQLVTSSVPTGYNVFYSACVNCIDHPANGYIAGSTATVNVPVNGFVDLWWKYLPTAVPTETGTIQGYKVDSNAQPFGSPGATITVAGQSFGPTTNPYVPTVPMGSQLVTSSVPAGYDVSHSICVNCYDHPASGYISGSSVTVNVPVGGFVDLWWKYVPSFTPTAQTLPVTTTQTSLKWPQVSGAASYQVFVNDMSDPAARMAGTTCGSSFQYYCSGDLTGITQPITVTSGHVYQWWVKSKNASGQVIEESESQAFAVARPQNQLDVRVSHSYMQPGESYYLYVDQPSGQADMSSYSGPLEVLVSVCQANNPNQCTAPVIAPWNTITNGKIKVSLPSNYAVGIYKAQFRPNSQWQWSNLIQVNVGTTAGLIHVPDYWNMQITGNFSGKNITNNTSFQNQIGYVEETICPGQPVTSMYFTKDKPQGYWNAEYPWPGWVPTDNLKWHLIPWQKQPGWHDEFLTSPGYHAYQFNPNSLLLEDNFTQQTHIVKYGTQDPEFPAYVLAPRWVGPGWGIRYTWQSYAVVIGQSASYCDTQIDFGNPTFSTWWTVLADTTVLHTPTYDGPVLHIKYGEGSLKEDWYFKEGTGLIKIQQKFFDLADGPCVNDYDCKQNTFPTKAFTTSVRSSDQEIQITYNGSNAPVQFSGSGWLNYPLADAYNNDEICTSIHGDFATLNFSAPEKVTRFKLYAAKAFNRAKMEVYIDGVSKGLFDAYDPGVQISKMIFDSGQLTPGTHEIKIVNRSADPNKPYIGIDKIVVSKQT